MVVITMTEYSESQMHFRKQVLSILLKNFDDNRAVYECADEWTSKFKTTSWISEILQKLFC